MDVVIPYRRNDSDELIYALRSLKNIEHGNVFVIGDNPRLNVSYIPFTQTTDIGKNTHAILTIACNTPEISDNFIWMHDDMYVMKPVKTIPVFHRGSYDQLLARYQNKYNYYIKRAIKTNEYLKSKGIQAPLSYEVHVPFVINKRNWLELGIPEECNKLSTYANLLHLGGIKVADVKVRTRDWVPTGSFASSHERTFRTNSLGKLVRDLFPERSIYES